MEYKVCSTLILCSSTALFELSNNLSGIATIKSFTAEAREVKRISRNSGAYQQANRSAINLSSAFSPLIRMVIVAGFIAIMVFGGQYEIETSE